MKARVSTAHHRPGLRAMVLLTRVSLAAMVLAGALASLPARSDTPQARVRLKLEKTLTSKYTYWFAILGRNTSTPRPLPAPNTHRTISLVVPAAYHKPRAQLRVLDIAHHRVAHLAIHDKSVTVASGAVRGQELIVNGDFAQSRPSWDCRMNSSKAKGTLEYSKEAPPPGVAGKVGRFQITAIDGVNWHVQGTTNEFDLQDKGNYTLSFWARADHTRPIFVAAQTWGTDYRLIGVNRTCQLSHDWQKFTVPFQPDRPLKDHNRVVFNLGDSIGTVELAGVSLTSAQAGPSPGSTQLTRSGDIEMTLTAADFKYVQTAHLLVREKGRAGVAPARDVQVILQNRSQPLGKYQITAGDNGMATLTEIPVNAPLTIRVVSGSHSSVFSRTLAANAGGVLPAIDLDWAVATDRGIDNRAPLVGVWENRPGAAGEKVRFTFNADGTGTLQKGAKLPPRGAPPQGPVNAFRWAVKSGSHQVMIGSQEYVWSLSRDNTLALTDFSGKEQLFPNHYKTSSATLMTHTAPTTHLTSSTHTTPNKVTTSEKAQYQFESGTQGWLSSGGMITNVTGSTAKTFVGTHALAVNIKSLAAGDRQQAYVAAPPTPAGVEVTFHVWIPAGSTISAVQPYVQQSAQGGWKWTGTYMPIASLNVGAWNTIKVTVPTNAVMPLYQLGVQFFTNGAWTGTCYVDSVSW